MEITITSIISFVTLVIGFISKKLKIVNKKYIPYQNILIGADTEAKVNAVIMRNDRQTAKNLYDSFVGSNNENYKKYAQQLNAKFGFSNTSITTKLPVVKTTQTRIPLAGVATTSLSTTPGYIYDWNKNSKDISFPDWQKQQGYAIGL